MRLNSKMLIILSFAISIAAIFAEPVKNHSPSCATQECTNFASDLRNKMDESINPCDDFYKFVCQGFEKNNIIPKDKSSFSPVITINDKLAKQLRAVLEEPVEEHEPKTFALIKKFYGACNKTDVIEADNLKTPKELIEKLGGWPVLGSPWNEDDFDWKTTTYKLRERGLQTNNFAHFFAETDMLNNSRTIMNGDQATLGLEREFLVKGFENEIVARYYNYLVDLAVAFGADRGVALKDLKDAVEFEISLAKITAADEDRRNATTMTNIMTLGELQKLHPSINWTEHLTKLANLPGKRFTENDLIDVGAKEYLTNLLDLLSRTPKRAQANYVMSQIVRSMIPFLTESLINRVMEYRRSFVGTSTRNPRWKECAYYSNELLEIAAGALYVRKYFDEESKKEAMLLIDYVRKEFAKVLNGIDWMDETTRRKGLEKLTSMKTYIGYPDEFLNDEILDKYYADLDFNTDSYLEMFLNIQKFTFANDFKQLDVIANPHDWTKHSQSTTVNAYYNFGENSIILPAGILQGVFFRNNRPSYINFGTMGFAIGHEIVHGFDDQGRQFDKNGMLSDWWQRQTKEDFLEKAQCIINQYNNYVDPVTGLHLNGINTQGENIADNGAVKISYLGYETWLKHNQEELPLPGLKYTPKQLFWISLASLWCSKDRKEYLSHRILKDSHSPSYHRIIGAFSNSEYFSNDFNCSAGTFMNPSHKCQLW